jgi:hypothetical protein
VKLKAVFLAILASLIVVAGSVAGVKTTGPGQRVTIMVVVNDHGLFVYDQAQMARGAIVTFQVFNSGKKTHGYSLLGRQTGAIKPRHWRHFTVPLLTRGRFPDGSPFDKGPAFHGFFNVY